MEYLQEVVGLFFSDAEKLLKEKGYDVVKTEYFTDKQPVWDKLIVIRAKHKSPSCIELVVGNFLLKK